jgi:hypothetical protein
MYESIISTVASFTMAIIVYYFNRKMLELSKKDRERPKIVELLQFCIIPVKEYLSETSQDNFQEFNLEEILRFGRVMGRGTYDMSILSKVLCVDFNTLLEKLNRKNSWDEKVRKYNELQRELSRKMENLKERLGKFVNESSDIKRIYEETEAKKDYSFDAFKRELTDACEFYRYYDQARLYNSHGEKWSLSGAWYFVGKDIFYHLTRTNEYILREIDKLKKDRDAAKNNLITELNDIQEQLKKEYNITPSEQTPLVYWPKITREVKEE